MNLEHYIRRSIRGYYKNKIIVPILYLLVLLIFWFVTPIANMVMPVQTDESADLAQLYGNDTPYVQITLHDLYFTGYTKEWLDSTIGYYYYTTFEDSDTCVVVLLTPEESQQGISTVENATIRAKILYNSDATTRLLENLATDLSWSVDGITATLSPYMLSQPDATGFSTNAFLTVYFLTGLYAFCYFVIYLIYILFPTISRPVQRLSCYGNPRKILAHAEEELATLPQLATEDMFITEHYFIETSKYGVAIVPIREIVWIYKYSTLHKFLWHHFSISYTLYITANKRQYIRCPKNIKSDIDGIMDYLSEANHNILVGFSEENRLKVEEIQGDLAPLKKLWAFLSRRV